jgi:hypothetical protein
MTIHIRSMNTSPVKSRGLIIGSPNTGKTSLLTSMPEEMVICLSFPDEKGIRSIPSTPNIQSITFECEPVAEDESLSLAANIQKHYVHSMEKYQAVLNATRSILKGNHGTADILFLDGLSKFYDLTLDIVTKGRYLQGIPFETAGDYTTRLYGNSHVLFRNYLSEIYLAERFSVIIATAWERLGQEEEDISESQKMQNTKQGQRVWLPALPGQMGNLAAGEFDWCIRAGFTLGRDCNTCQMIKKKGGKALDDYHHTFQLAPDGKVQCVGMKGMRGRRVPTYIHQEWADLKQFIL